MYKLKEHYTNNELIKHIKDNNFKLVIVTLDDMSVVVYADNSNVNTNNRIDKIDYLGILGFAYKHDMELQWIKISNGRYAVFVRNSLNNYILHHTLDKNAKDYDSNILSLKKAVSDE